MRIKLEKIWDDVWTSLWFLPIIMVACAVVVSSVLLAIDAHGTRLSGMLFGGTADAARTVLATIAGSLVTVISVAFSITIVALQQAAVQFTPRVLRTFIADHGNQLVLGAYTATFVYALLVLRAIRSASGTQPQVEFVPGLSVTVAIGLAVVCLGLLIYFINHIAQSLQVSVIIGHVHTESLRQINALYPEHVAARHDDPVPPTFPSVLAARATLRSHQAGFIRTIDEEALSKLPLGTATAIWIVPQIGAYVSTGGLLAAFTAGEMPDEETCGRLRDAFVFASARSPTHDPAFGIRQLVDLALKALSPGINDPTTAEYALNALCDLLGHLVGRVLPSPTRVVPERQVRLVFTRPTWDDFVDLAFSQVRYAAVSNAHVTLHLVGVLDDLAQHVAPGSRGRAIARQLDRIAQASSEQPWSADDQAVVRAHINAATTLLATTRGAD